MTIQRFLISVFAIVALSTAAYGQFDMMGGGDDTSPPATAWSFFKLDKTTRLTLDFRNASIDAVLHEFSTASGVTIIKDPALTEAVTLQSPKPQGLDDAFAMLNAVLGLKNYQLVHQGNFLLVSAKPAGGGAAAWQGMAAAGGGGGASRSSLKVYTIKYASATELARVINDVYAPTPAAAGPAFPFAGGFGGGGFGGGGFGGGGAAAFAARRAAGGGAGGQNGPTVKASADDYSNSIVVNAPSAIQRQIGDLIAQIDKPTDTPMKSRVFKLLYAIASDLQPVIQNVLAGNAPLGRGNTTTASASTQGRPGGFGGGGGGFFAALQQQRQQQTAGGTAIADPRTNSIVVVATQDNLDHVAEVIKQLDKPTRYQSTTWVYTLKNARADVVANLLNTSFGIRSTNGPVGGSLTNTGPSQGTISVTGSTSGAIGGTSPTSGSSSSYGGAGGAGNRGGGGNNPFFSGLSGGASSSASQTGDQAGIDTTGRVINIRNLYGQVQIIPNIDTNSVIVVAPPEDKKLVTALLDEMDVIPAQVMIETLVVEVNLDKTDQFGVEWAFNSNTLGIKNGNNTTTQSFGLQSNTTQPQGLRTTLTAGQLTAFLSAIKTDTRFDVLSTPRIFATNNATSQINVSQSVPYVTNQTVDTTGTVLYNYDFLNVGIVLTVTPRITSNGYVIMDVTQTANDLQSYTSFNAPIVNQRETQTSVNVKDGETIVLGGIIENSINDTVNKVPILGDIPILGSLFRSTSKVNDHTELLVFLTPHVIRNPEDARTLRENTEKELGKDTRTMIPQSYSGAIANPNPPSTDQAPADQTPTPTDGSDGTTDDSGATDQTMPDTGTDQNTDSTTTTPADASPSAGGDNQSGPSQTPAAASPSAPSTSGTPASGSPAKPSPNPPASVTPPAPSPVKTPPTPATN